MIQLVQRAYTMAREHMLRDAYGIACLPICILLTSKYQYVFHSQLLRYDKLQFKFCTKIQRS